MTEFIQFLEVDESFLDFMMRLQSTVARVMVIEIGQGDINKGKLKGLQIKAGLLPHAMCSYPLWVKGNMADIKKAFPKRFIELRERASNIVMAL